MLDRNAIWIHFSAVIFAASALAACMARKRSSCSGTSSSVLPKDRMDPKTKSDGTSPFSPAMSFRALISSRRFKLSDRFV